MDRDSLRARLDAEGISPASYSLDGLVPDEAYVLEAGPDAFCVFYSERGLRSGEAAFTTEDEACQHLLGLLLRDPTTRVDGRHP